jgi:hypothetical protein
MVSLASLWLPILLSAAAVFFVSSIIHMLLPYHRHDFGPLPDEDAVANTLRNAGPGDYLIPYASSNAERNAPAYKEKWKSGPISFISILPPGQGMGKQLGTWFAFAIVVSIFAAYVAGRALDSGAEYLEVFRFAGVTGFLGYGMALVHDSIWYGRKWSTTLKYLFDALLYGLVTAGMFGWLWPA